MLIVNDNLGVIVNQSYLDSKSIVYNDKILKGSRTVEDFQHEKEELRLSLKIAKINASFDPRNKYYQEQLEKAQFKWDSLNKQSI